MRGHARNIMTGRVTAVAQDAQLANIARTLAEGGFGGVPVVDAEEQLVGFVSESDIMDALLRGDPDDTTARALMSSPAITVDEFDTADEVVRVLREKHIHHLPVVRQSKLVGIIAPSDVIRWFAAHVGPPPPEPA